MSLELTRNLSCQPREESWNILRINIKNLVKCSKLFFFARITFLMHKKYFTARIKIYFFFLNRVVLSWAIFFTLFLMEVPILRILIKKEEFIFVKKLNVKQQRNIFKTWIIKVRFIFSSTCCSYRMFSTYSMYRNPTVN